MYIYLCLERYEEAYELVNMLLYEYLFENSIDKEQIQTVNKRIETVQNTGKYA